MHSTQKLVTALVTPARTLRAAARHLARYGWVQGYYYDPCASVFTPSACVVGAIGFVCYGGPVDCPAQLFDEPGFDEFEAAFTVLDAYLSEHGIAETAYEFNDAQARTAAQVIAVLHDAADQWERWLPQAAATVYRLLEEAGQPVQTGGARLIAGGAA